MELQFLNRAADLLELDPVFSFGFVSRIEEIERYHKRRLPKAIKEWYCLNDGQRILNDPERYNCCLPLEEFLNRFLMLGPQSTGEIYFFGGDRYNTGINTYVVLDGSDDPIVEARDVDPPDTSAFSEFIQCFAWDFVISEHFSVISFNPNRKREPTYCSKCGPKHLEFLSQEFNEMSQTVERSADFKFYRKHQRVSAKTIGGSASKDECDSEYILSANTVGELADLYEMFWPIHGASLKVFCGDSQRVLDEFNRRFTDAKIVSEE